MGIERSQWRVARGVDQDILELAVDHEGGGGAGCDTLTFAANEGAHVYSDGTNWYVLGCGPGCTVG